MGTEESKEDNKEKRRGIPRLRERVSETPGETVKANKVQNKDIKLGDDDPDKKESNTKEGNNKFELQKAIADPLQEQEVKEEIIRKQDTHSEGLLNKNENNEVWSSTANLPPGWKTVKGKAIRPLGRIHGQTKSRL